MITYLSGDLFQSPAQVLVNTVNTVGVMGKGIALTFKRVYPEMFKSYQDYCERGELKTGCLFLHKTPYKWILNFPTKKHWRNPSKLEYIEAGLEVLYRRSSEMGITSIAFPELGCGNGELDFETQVKPLMESYLRKLSLPSFIYVRGGKSQPPEHKDVSNIKRWLRSEPSALPFDEVWEDVVSLLAGRQQFHTLAQRNRFTPTAVLNPPTIKVVSGRSSKRFVAEELLEFWRLLRDFGLTYGSIAPDRRHSSYLMPIFAELPYVEPIALSSSFDVLRSNPTTGLQVVPPPRSTVRTTGDLLTRLDNAAQG